MTNEEIQATLALPPKEAAAIIFDKFRARQRFETNPKGDAYFFIVDPSILYPEEVREQHSPVTAEGYARHILKVALENFGEAVVRNNMDPESDWGVVGYDVIGPDSTVFRLNVEPGYMERGGRIRKGVDPRVMPLVLVHLRSVKEQLDARVKIIVEDMSHAGWWRQMGLLDGGARKQDWSPRED